MDTGPHAVGRTEFGHPDEHDDAQFLGPAEVQGEQPVLQAGYGDAGSVAVSDRQKDDQGRPSHEKGYEPFLQVIENFHYCRSLPGTGQSGCYKTSALGPSSFIGIRYLVKPTA